MRIQIFERRFLHNLDKLVIGRIVLEILLAVLLNPVSLLVIFLLLQDLKFLSSLSNFKYNFLYSQVGKKSIKNGYTTSNL